MSWKNTGGAKWLRLALFTGLLLAADGCGKAAAPDDPPSAERKIMNRKLQIQTGDHTLTAVLYDSAAARDFMAQLPLTLTLSDFNSTEKIADLPERLSTDGAPEGFTPVAGDIAYYAPWGNLAIFYRNFRYSRQLIHLGKIDGDAVKMLLGPESRSVTLRLADE